MLLKTPFKIVIDENFYEKARQKKRSKKHAQKSANSSFSKKAVLNFLSKITMQRFRPKHWQKFAPREGL